MQNTSALYKQKIRLSGRTFRVKILVTFSDGTTAELTDDHIMQDSLVITSGTTDEGSFSIGNAVIGQLEVEIDNHSGMYGNTSFAGAVLDVRIALITKQKYDGTLTPEWIRKGIFTVEEETVDENTIKLTAFDALAKLDIPFSELNISFPVTLGSLYRQICTGCGVSYGTAHFDNDDLVIQSDGEIDEDTGCRDMLSYIAQLCCQFVYADVYGAVRLGWYRHTNYTITEQQKISGTVSVTGVRLTDCTDTAHQVGTDAYCIDITDNPLAESGAALEASVWNQTLIGLSLTPFSADVLSDPSLEAGDVVTVSDRHGRTYQTPITNIVYRLDGSMTISCDAETANERKRTRCGVSAKIVQQTNRKINHKISEYDIRAKRFSELTANAMGYYQTEQTQSDGSTIVYQHDKPLLSDSTVIWKKSVDSIAVSHDGGQTWQGMDSSGNAVTNILSAVGIVADWISAGTLSGVTIEAQTGTIAGWHISGNKLVSDDGSMEIDSDANNITVYDENHMRIYVLNQNGLHFYYGDDRIGFVGTNRYADDPTKHGLVFQLDDGGEFMSWGVRDEERQVFASKFSYSRTNQQFTVSEKINISNLKGYTIVPRTATIGGTTIQYWGWDAI